MADISRPSIVIGLGGTGKWVLTYIKKNLLDTYSGEIPGTVELISFDTTQERGSKQGVAEEEDVRVGDVQLDSQSEFVYLGGNIYQLCNEIRDQSAYPNISSWLQASTYLGQFEPDAFDLSSGAGQKRPFGRMAIFYDLQQRQRNRVANKLQTAINNVLGAKERQQPVCIYIVGSLAGGTGSGMFIDVAHLARWLTSRQSNDTVLVRGFLALQNTFTSVIKTRDIDPRAFAAMRELDRFMLVFDQSYPIVYNEQWEELKTIYGKEYGKLFDNCYLLDAKRDHFPLDSIKPNHGVFPSIADSITMLLDARTGDTFDQHYVNVNTTMGTIQNQTNRPMYSSLGAYSLILPVEDIITSLTYRFSIELLGEYWLHLRQVPSEDGKVHYVLHYEGNEKEEAAGLLNSPESITSKVINTNFIQRVPSTVQKANSPNTVYVDEVANMEAAELLTWVLPPSSDSTISDLAQKVQKALETRLVDTVLPSNEEGDDPSEGAGRITNQIQRFRDEHLGRDVGGRRAGGSYREALTRCVDTHKDRYFILLKEYLLRLLNGSEPNKKDYQDERCGKLGQAQAVLSSLARYFRDLSAFIDRVEKRRTGWDMLRQAQEDAKNAQIFMNEERDNIGFIARFGFKDMAPAIKAQKNYIDAEQQVLDIEVVELFFDFLKHMSEELRIITEEFKEDIDSWVQVLVSGFTGVRNDSGLYHALCADLRQHQTKREQKKRISVHEYATDEQYENQIYQDRTTGKFAEALTQLIWNYESKDGRLRLTLSSLVSATAQTWGGKTPTQRNVDILLGIARNYFTPLRKELNIADRLKDLYAPKELARMLLDKCGPLIRYDPLKGSENEELRNFVCVNEGNNQAYFNEFAGELKDLGQTAKDNQVIDSSNAYTCTILSTADIVASDGLYLHRTAERAYNEYSGDARLLHIFPAEVNAVEIEQQLSDIREPRRRFVHRLTTMLEDRSMVRRFIFAYLYGFIGLDPVDNQTSHWSLIIWSPNRNEEDTYVLTSPDPEPTLFEAMECFVFYRADIKNRTIKIPMAQLDREIQRYENEVSTDEEGETDESRLINFLEQVRNTHVAALLKSTSINDQEDEVEEDEVTEDKVMRDLVSLMKLEIKRYINSLQSRLRTNRKQYRRDAKPRTVLTVRERIRERDRQSKGIHTPSSSPLPLTEVQPIGSSDIAQEEQKLSELKDFLDDGVITQEHYISELKRLLDDGVITQEQYDSQVSPAAPPKTRKEKLRELKEMLEDGLLTQERYDEKVSEILKDL